MQFENAKQITIGQAKKYLAEFEAKKALFFKFYAGAIPFYFDNIEQGNITDHQALPVRQQG